MHSCLWVFRAGIHLAEAGNTMIRNVDFEIPYFKKLAEKTQHQLADQEHKHEEYLRSAEAATRDYTQVEHKHLLQQALLF